jgi:hypothetical protein
MSSALKIHAVPEGPPVYLRLVDGEWVANDGIRPLTAEDWATEIARLDTEEDLAERERKKTEKTATQLKMDVNRWRAIRKPKPQKVGTVAETVQEVLVEDRRRFSFRYYLGTEGAWNGPGALWTEDRRCVFCGHLARLSTDTACLNPDCCRTGMDFIIGGPTPAELARLARMGPPEASHATRYDPDRGLKGGVG